MALRVHICSQAIKSMNDDDEEENQASEEVQDYRRDLLLNQMLEAAQATNRAAKLVSNIVARNQDRMFLDKSGRILVNGTLATYRVDMGAFLNKMNNPFDYSSFDQVEIHPKGTLVDQPKTACVQVQINGSMPAYDLLGAYLLGLMNDELTWLQENMGPLRHALYAMYGLRESPLTSSLSEYFFNKYGGLLDNKKNRIILSGTNGWKWRVSFGNPLARGFKIEYSKPRQSWWNDMFEDHLAESSQHYTLCGFFDLVDHLSQSPAILREASEWNTDPIFVRKVAAVYPPLAKKLLTTIESDDYDPSLIQSFYDETITEEEATTVALLDEQIRNMALA
jgi:hypothetical protein